eukprot:1076298-Prymnesium_polylepis.1
MSRAVRESHAQSSSPSHCSLGLLRNVSAAALMSASVPHTSEPRSSSSRSLGSVSASRERVTADRRAPRSESSAREVPSGPRSSALTSSRRPPSSARATSAKGFSEDEADGPRPLKM